MNQKAIKGALLIATMTAVACSSPAQTGTPAGGDPSPGDNTITCDSPFVWPVATSPISITPSSASKNQLSPGDPFVAHTDYNAANPMSWVKFVILMRDPSKVYFQNTNLYPFHADFAVAQLDPFHGMSRAEFDAVSLHAAGQEAILGAVLFPPPHDPNIVAPNEMGIQLVRQEPYHHEMVRAVFELVRASIILDPAPVAFYFPTYEQEAMAQTCRTQLLADGIDVSSTERWLSGDACYSGGWALGRFTYVESTQIQAAYLAGSLRPTDILVTNAVPAEVPFVAGIVALSAGTPNSHVAILCRADAIPFLFAHREATRNRVNAALGKEAVLRADMEPDGTCSARVILVEGRLDASTRAQILALKEPPPVEYAPKQSCAALSANVDTLSPADVGCFGGKASNFGLLRDVLPDHSPVAMAFSFALWDGFLARPTGTGESLGSAIATRIQGITYPPDMAALAATLAEVRALVLATDFSPTQKSDMLAALSGFDPLVRLRFRSSTNVEDGATFTGAGLYDSVTGCLADDLDADSLGPSACDPLQALERGVFRAIRKVIASFYLDNAFLERLRRGVDEGQVGMAILVHVSFPDETELANGVATMDVQGTVASTISLVSQPGAASVTNPSLAAAPEIVRIDEYGFGVYPTMIQYSGLLPLSETVLTWDGEYRELATYLRIVADHFAAVTTTPAPFTLDFEYKKSTAQGLLLKQVRQLPRLDPSLTVDTFLVDEDLDLCVFQGELALLGDSVFGFHRAKMRWDVSTQSGPLTDAFLGQSFFGPSPLIYVDGTAVATLLGRPADWPSASHALVAPDTITDTWTLGAGADLRTYLVTTSLIARQVSQAHSPILSLRDFNVGFRVSYATPQAQVDSMGNPQTATQDTVTLKPCREPGPLATGSKYREIVIDLGGGRSIAIRFWHPPDPTGIVAGYTAPLEKWDSTTITGFTTEPVVLVGEFSQTYGPYHHNFNEEFVFEPGLEETLDASQRAELVAADVYRIWAVAGAMARIQGFDGVFRAP